MHVRQLADAPARGKLRGGPIHEAREPFLGRPAEPEAPFGRTAVQPAEAIGKTPRQQRFQQVVDSARPAELPVLGTELPLAERLEEQGVDVVTMQTSRL